MRWARFTAWTFERRRAVCGGGLVSGLLDVLVIELEAVVKMVQSRAIESLSMGSSASATESLNRGGGAQGHRVALALGEVWGLGLGFVGGMLFTEVVQG